MRKPHQFRFQVFHRWILDHYPPCNVGDIGGGKGLLSFLLNRSGYSSTIIDPVWQPLEWKYKDLETGRRIKLTPDEMNSVPHVQAPFTPELLLNLRLDLNLLVGLHAHGSNIFILEAAARMGLDFAVIPCCVIDEPVIKKPGINWFDSLVERADSLGLHPRVDTLDFVGQSRVIYSRWIDTKTMQA